MMTTVTWVANAAIACDNTTMSSSVALQQRSNGEWAVSAEQRSGGELGRGEVILRLDAAPLGQPPHAALAQARAWRALGDAKLASGDFDGAITCARGGLEALGPDYAGYDVADDTDLKLAVAAERLADGHTSDAASIMLRMLRSRDALYVDKHTAVIVR